MKKYYIRHTINKKAYIKTAIFPPRLCEWTECETEAQLFELEQEKIACSEFITKQAFAVEVAERI